MMTNECGVNAPSGLASLAFGHPSGHKTKDESFVQNTQLSSVLMLPSQNPLRDISIVCENPKTFRVASLRSASSGSRNPSGVVLPSASLRSARKAQKMKGLKAKALRCAQLNKPKIQKLKVKGASVPSAKQALLTTPAGHPLERLTAFGEISTKDERLKGVKTFKVLKSKGASVPSARYVLLLSWTSSQRAHHPNERFITTSASQFPSLNTNCK